MTSQECDGEVEVVQLGLRNGMDERLFGAFGDLCHFSKRMKRVGVGWGVRIFFSVTGFCEVWNGLK